ncbi:FkbM family methyltransferase [Hippea sp. KM1]|uniref:FkbM family methyltransferase n=1 Tax=Hippea sp. KM1 TaxID=944481 RepID=UPI00046D6277|nr:FkbM family methyltransferase [Hippea sp. KM1]
MSINKIEDRRLLGEKTVILFGAGGLLSYAINELSKLSIEVAYISDNNKNLHGTKVNGIEIIPPDKIKDKNLPVLITSMYAKEIASQLKSMGIEEYCDFSYSFDLNRWIEHFDLELINKNIDKINEARELFEDIESKEVFDSILEYRRTLKPDILLKASYDNYFHPLASPKKNDVIIDGGAWHGDTCINFASKLKNRCTIYSFEPEENNFNKLKNSIYKHKLQNTVFPIKKGLYNKECTLFIDTNVDNDMQFQIRTTNTGKAIEMISIDIFIKQENISKIDFIKMDIEGSEYKALEGSKKTIERFKPKLAICIYHLYNDLWEIPLLIKRLNSQYRLYLGHHSQNLLDTVLYAV